MKKKTNENVKMSRMSKEERIAFTQKQKRLAQQKRELKIAKKNIKRREEFIDSLVKKYDNGIYRN